MNDLVERYLHAVGGHLREARRDDILEDLRAAIEDEIEGRAESLHRPLQPDELAAVLEGFGHPLSVARSYQPPRYLIGPELYPDWWRILRLAIIVALAIQVPVLLIVGATSGWVTGPFGLLWQSLSLAFWVAAWVTVVFVALEYSGERLGWRGRWRAAALVNDSTGPIRRGDVLTNLFSEGVFLLWWNGVIKLDQWIPPNTFSIDLGAAWQPLYWPLNVIFGLAFVLHLLVLWRGVWQRWTLVTEIALNLTLVAVIAYLVLAPDLLMTRGAPADLAGPWLERTLRVALLVIAGFTLWDALAAFRAYWRDRNERPSRDAVAAG